MKKKIIKALCLGGLVPPMLVIRHEILDLGLGDGKQDVYEVSISRGATWEFISVHFSLEAANKSFGKQLDKAIENC